MSKEVLLASCGNDVKLFSLPDYKLVNSFAAHSGLTADITWNFDNSIIYSIGNNDVLAATNISKLINERKYKESFTKINHNKIYATKKTNGLYSAGVDGMCLQWDVKGLAPKKAFKSLNGTPSCLICNQSEDQIILGMSVNHNGNAIQMFDIHSSASQIPNIYKLLPSEGVECIQFSPFLDNIMGCSTTHGSLHLWDVNSKTITRTFLNETTERESRNSLAFSPMNEKLVVSVTNDGRLQMHDILQYSLVSSSSVCTNLTSISFFSDGATIAIGNKKGKILIFDLRMALIPLHRMSAHTVPITKLIYQTNIESIIRSSKLFAQIQYKNAEVASTNEQFSTPTKSKNNYEEKKDHSLNVASLDQDKKDKLTVINSFERIFTNPNDSFSLYSPIKDKDENDSNIEDAVIPSEVCKQVKQHLSSSKLIEKPLEQKSIVKTTSSVISDDTLTNFNDESTESDLNNKHHTIDIDHSFQLKKLLETFIVEQRSSFDEIREQIHQTKIFFNTEMAKIVHSHIELKKLVINNASYSTIHSNSMSSNDDSHHNNKQFINKKLF